MQFYALEEDRPILVTDAERHKDYRCPECQALVRVRKGMERKAHFYHLSTPPTCHQHNKTLTHLQVQWTIQALLPAGEAKMERPFPEIGRIADIAWESAKIVFEVQYSPITLQEACARCADYQSLGYTPIWILHKKQFNKRKVRAAENLLRQTGCYYTDIDEKGHGEIYDQFDICRKGRRLFRGPQLKVDISKHQPTLKEIDLPQALSLRLNRWPIYFSGDLLDRFMRAPSPSMQRLEERFSQKPKPLSFLQSFKRIYQIFFRMALERVCR